MKHRFHIRREGQWRAVSAEEYAAHRSASGQPSSVFPPSPGLGDLVAAVATPIARVLKLPCIDPVTQQLRPESGCAKRKAALNRVKL